MKTLIMNFQSVIRPKGFVDMGLTKRKYMALYGICIAAVIVLLCDVLPTQLQTAGIADEINEAVEQYVPEFELSNNEMTVNQDEEYIIPADSGFFYFNTSAEKFSANYNDSDYIGAYLTQEQLNSLNSSLTQGIFVSRTNVISYNNGLFQTLSFAELSQLFGWQGKVLTKETVKQSMPGWIQFCLIFYYVALLIGVPISLFLFSLTWSLAAVFMNAVMKGRYPYRVLYAATVYVRVIVLFVRHIIDNFSFLSTGQVNLICRALMLLLVILAVAMKVSRDGSYSPGLVDIKYAPGGYVVGKFEQNDFNSDMFSNRPFDPIGGQGQGYADTGYNPNPAYFAGNQPQPANTGYNPNPAYQTGGQFKNGSPQYNRVYQPSGQIHTNTGYNPNPAYSAGQQANQYGTPAMTDEKPEEQKYARPDLAQDSSFVSKTPVWKPQETGEGLGGQAYTSQAWKPQAHSDYKKEKEKWNQMNQTWNPRMNQPLNQEWNPQRPGKPADDPFGGGTNQWEQQQKWRGAADKSNPALSGENNASDTQWNQGPVWGKKDDPFH